MYDSVRGPHLRIPESNATIATMTATASSKPRTAPNPAPRIRSKNESPAAFTSRPKRWPMMAPAISTPTNTIMKPQKCAISFELT